MASPVPVRVFPALDRRLAMMLVAASAIGVYSGTVAYGFVFDDFLWIVQNPAVRSFRAALATFLAGQVANHHYRPLAVLSFALDHRLAGVAPLLYHLENVLLHAAVCLVLFALSSKYTSRGTALLAAGLFAVLPVHSEVVANVVNRTELLAALFGLLALLTLHRWLPAGVFLLLALFSKESAITIPVLALLLLAVRHFRLADESGPESGTASQLKIARWTVDLMIARLAAVLCAVVAVYLACYYHALGHFRWPRYPMLMLGNPLAFVDLATRLRTAVMILGQNLALCFIPYHFSADYSLPQIPLATAWLDSRWLASAGLLTSAVLAAVLTWRRNPRVALGVAWFLVAIAPVSNLLMPIGTIRGDRLLYLPSAGACLVLAEALIWLGGRARVVAIVVSALALTGNAGVAAARSTAWRDMPTITRVTVADSPNSAKAHFDFAAEHARRGDCPAAIPEFERALALWPDFNQARLALGECRLNLGDAIGAAELFEQAAAREPDNAAILPALISACAGAGRWNCAANAIVQLMALDANVRNSPQAWNDLASAYGQAGRSADAQRAQNEAARLATAPPAPSPTKTP